MPLSVLLSAMAARPSASLSGYDRVEQLLEHFQLVVAATEALERIGRISILEIREENRTGRRLIEAVRVRRLK